ASTIDQPGTAVAHYLHGDWQAPSRTVLESEVGLFVGVNPFIAHTLAPTQNTHQWVKEASAKGTKLIVIDPRQTELARHAFLHIQPIPGEDVAILAAIAKIILEEDLEDAAFLADNVDGLEALRESVAGYDAEIVARRAGISVQDIELAARTLGSS